MIHFLLDSTRDDQPTIVSVSGSQAEIATDIALCATVLYSRTREADPIAALVLKKALMAVFAEDSPVWTAEIAKGAGIDRIQIITGDPRAAKRKQEGHDADA